MSSIQIETHWVDTSGRPARVEVIGGADEGDVLIVGSAVPMAWSRPAARAMAERGFRVINFDYEPPEWWSANPVARTCVDQIEDVSAVTGATGFDRGAVVGLSRGAITALGLASRLPDLVDHLVLAFPVAGFGDTLGIEGVEPTPSDDPLEALDAALDTAFSREFLLEHRDEARDLFLTDRASVVRVERAAEEPLGDHETTTAPTLIVTGGADQVVTPEHPRRLSEAIPHSRMHQFEEASHGFIMEQPDAFADVVVAFLRR